MATATERPQVSNVQDLVQVMAKESPEVALQIAMAETQRVQALAQKAAEEYRSMSELDLDDQGRIKKANMAGLWRLARIYAESDIVPEHYRGRPANCFIACQLAFRWQADPMMVMQSSYIVHGRPGLEGKLVSALLNSSGKIEGRIRYRFEGEGKDRKCTAFAKDRETGDMVESTVPWSMVEAEKWDQDKKSKSGYVQVSKWKTMPDVMFQYRAATFLVRLFYPEVLMGMRTVDELEDMAEPERSGGEKPRTLDEVIARERGKAPTSYVGPMPSDAELLEREKNGTLETNGVKSETKEAESETAEASGETANQPESPEEGFALQSPGKAEPALPVGLFGALQQAVTLDAVEKVRQDLVAGTYPCDEEVFNRALEAVKQRGEEVQASIQQAAASKKGRK